MGGKRGAFGALDIFELIDRGRFPEVFPANAIGE
jgi:hypothetical protein